MDSVKAIAGRVAIFVAMHHACPLEGSPCRVHLQARSFSNLSFAMATTSLDKSKIKFLLLEGIHPSALDVIRAAGYSQIETVAGALPDDELKRKIADAHFVGIRTRTQLTSLQPASGLSASLFQLRDPTRRPGRN